MSTRPTHYDFDPVERLLGEVDRDYEIAVESTLAEHGAIDAVAALGVTARTYRDIADQIAREHEDEHQGPQRFCATYSCRMAWEAANGYRVGEGRW